MQGAIAPPDPRLAARVPRYTSYPPANHFSERVSSADTAAWLAAIDTANPVSVYVHIPFCRRLCWFCACRTQGTPTAAPVAGYLDDVERELDLVAAHLPAGTAIGHIHLGGGTPTIMTPDQIGRLIAAVGARIGFADRPAFASEVDPTELDDARLDALAAAGLTRASVGVQDFDARIQAAIGRPQSFDITRSAVDGLRRRGVGSLNIDLLYGLPHQTPRTLGATLDKVIVLRPDRLALYGYAHVPWMAKRQRLIPEEALPNSGQRQVLAETARERLLAAGYVAVGIDHFALPGDSMAIAAGDRRLRRNFQGYTTDVAGTLIGIGASAVSHFAQGYVQNAARTGNWVSHLNEGRLPTARGHALTDEDRLRGAVISDIMCHFECDVAARARTMGIAEDALDASLAALQRDLPDVVERDGRRLRLVHDDGRFARLAAAAFDAYLKPAQDKYSLAL